MGYDLSSFKNVAKWYPKIQKEAPKYEQTNGEGLKAFKALADSKKK